MKNICLVGVKNIFFEKTMLRFMKDYIYVSENETRVSCLTKGRLFVYDTAADFTDIGAVYEGMIFKNDFFSPFDIRKRLDGRGIVLLSEGCPRAASTLDGLGMRYNVCGLDRGCGIMPSSISEDTVTVSLRNIVRLDGSLVCDGEEYRLRGNFNVYNICPAMMGSVTDRLFL